MDLATLGLVPLPGIRLVATARVVLMVDATETWTDAPAHAVRPSIVASADVDL